MIKRFFLLFLILFSLPLVYSQDYYADIEIIVENTGEITVEGITNYEKFENITNSQEYTSKDGAYWLLNISSDVIFSEYIFDLTLPKNSNINYIKTTRDFRIIDSEEGLKIEGFGENKVFNLLVQYSINTPIINEETKDPIIFLLSAVIGIAIFILLFITFVILGTRESSDNKVVDIDLDKFSPRQQDILKIIKEKKKVTQKDLEEKMEIPKSSISRNVKTLQIKGIIEKVRIGNTNYLFLKKK